MSTHWFAGGTSDRPKISHLVMPAPRPGERCVKGGDVFSSEIHFAEGGKGVTSPLRNVDFEKKEKIPSEKI